jgi:hypothetical protein
MHRQRLIEAITANNPADVALKNVMVACERTLKTDENHLYCLKENKKGNPMLTGEANSCILAHAWRQPFKYIAVGADSYEIGNIGGNRINHPYRDVVEWFDGYYDEKQASSDVIKLLKGEVQEID